MSTVEGTEGREGVVVDEWHSLYNESWKGLISEASFAHPAKMALGLLRKIFAHAKEEGWLAPKSIVLDPFAGIGTTAMEALINGCAFQGVELEPRFFALAQANIAQWIHEYRHLPTFGPWAMIVNGDSRRLLEHIPAPFNMAVSSPPYTDQDMGATRRSLTAYDQGEARTRQYGETPGNLGTMPPGDLAISSPPFGSGDSAGPESLHRRTDASAKAMLKDQGWRGGGQVSPGNMATMHMAVSSPPYADAGKPDARNLHFDDQRAPDGRTRREVSIAQKQAHGVPDSYGDTPGNLANLSVSSPPFLDQGRTDMRPQGGMREALPHTRRARTHNSPPGISYVGDTEGQLGAMAPGMVVSSPPFVDARQNTTPSKKGTTAPTQHDPEAFGTTPGNLASLSVSSPPYASTDTKPHALGTGKGTRATGESADRNKGDYHYPTSPGQLASMAVSSPPYSTSTQVNNHPQDMTAGKARWAGGTDSAARVKQDYVEPETPGNLSTLAVSSPPYADGCGQQGHDYHPERMVGTRTGYLQRDHAGYGESQGQLTDELPNDFWSASKTILAQTFALLRPGGHAIFVTKRYVRAGKIVEFTQDWIRCCESVGFRLLHHHKAMLVEHHGTQTTLFGDGDKIHETRRESFFRRLARMKGSPAIEWEDVCCFIKDGDGGNLDLCASSPPYAVGLGKEHTYADPAKREKDSHRRIMREKHIADPFYGSAEGNLGNMTTGPADLILVDGATYGTTPGNLSTLPEDTPKRSRRPRKPRVVQGSVPTPEDTP